MSVIWLVSGMVAFVAGVVVIWRGWFRRVGAEPRCRRCDFDLTGIAVLRRCPECAFDVSDGRNPLGRVVGHPRRSSRALLAGVALLGFSGLAVGRVGFGGTVLERTPTWWLQYVETRLAVGEEVSGVLNELLVRRQANALSDDALRALALRGLALQKDFDGTWYGAWGDVIVTAWGAGVLSDAEIGAFYRYSGRREITSCFPIDPGEGSVMVKTHEVRGRSWSDIGRALTAVTDLEVVLTLDDIRIDGEPGPVPTSERLSLFLPRTQPHGLSLSRFRFSDTLPSGPHRLEATASYVVRPFGGDPTKPPYLAWEESVDLEIHGLSESDLVDVEPYRETLDAHIKWGTLQTAMDGSRWEAQFDLRFDTAEIDFDIHGARLGSVDGPKVSTRFLLDPPNGVQRYSFRWWPLPERPAGPTVKIYLIMRHLRVNGEMIGGFNEPIEIEADVVDVKFIR